MKWRKAGISTAVAMMIAVAIALLSPTRLPPSQAGTFTCTAISVHDGDGPIHCLERGADGKAIKIRLQAIAAREIDETCRDNQPCPAASAASARAALARLAVGHRLRCEPTGTSYGRVTAWCSTEAEVDLSCAMVRGGYALRWDRYDRDRRLCRP